MGTRLSLPGSRSTHGRRRKWPLYLGSVIVVGSLSMFGIPAATAVQAVKTAPAVSAGSVAPNPASEVDCNGWSPKYQTIRKMAGATCVDPIKVASGQGKRFYDNGHYVGHDEPSVKFISGAAGSGNTMSYLARIPVDPRATPTPNGSVTSYGELSIAP